MRLCKKFPKRHLRVRKESLLLPGGMCHSLTAISSQMALTETLLNQRLVGLHHALCELVQNIFNLFALISAPPLGRSVRNWMTGRRVCYAISWSSRLYSLLSFRRRRLLGSHSIFR